jgi:CheY-like chemotaxis protein
VVEDESELRRLVREDLENQGYTVLEASDGASAIEVSKAHAGPIHLLLTDVIMPGMNGSELARRLSILRPEMKALFMSGYTDNAIAHEGMGEEGISLLRKPFALSTLRANVREKLTSSLRAQRFNLQLPLRYRLAGAGDWRKGTTKNISRSGVLFRTEDMIPLRARLEINLVLPPQIAGLAATEVFCRGEVVRTLPPEQPAMSPALAAKILEYKFHYRSQGPQGLRST